MKKEDIQEFTRRISQSNGSGLTVITYEILFAYMNDAREAYEKNEKEKFKQSIRMGQKSIQELIDTLNFSYDLAKELYQLYVFCKEQLAVAMYKYSTEEIDVAERLMRKMYVSFEKVAKSDNSAPIMQNTQQVYAGYTYGKSDVVENYQGLDKSRGFLA